MTKQGFKNKISAFRFEISTALWRKEYYRPALEALIRTGWGQGTCELEKMDG